MHKGGKLLDKSTRKNLLISSFLPCEILRFRDIINIIKSLWEGDAIVYQAGDRVVYGIHGVCQVLELQMQTVNRKKVEYYVLEPVAQTGARFFVPSQNELAVSKMRPVLTKEQIDSLLRSDQSRQNIWIDDENRRKQYYRELIVDGDRAALLSMVRALHSHKEQQTLCGKKFHVSDANFLRDAQKVLYSEFAMVLNIPYEQVEPYINQF